MYKDEVNPDFLEVMWLLKDSAKREMRVALPGIVESFDASALTCAVQPAVKVPVRAEDGTITTVALPLIVDCPVQFPGAGGYTLTFPVARGDECLIIFADRTIDAWWQSGGVGEAASFKMHDLSDGFVLLGFRSQPRALSGFSTSSTQLRSDDGSTYVEIDSTGGIVSLKAPTEILMDAPTVRFTGVMAVENQGGADTSVSINGKTSFNGQVLANGKRIDDSHTHNGVQSGTGNSGNVN